MLKLSEIQQLYCERHHSKIKFELFQTNKKVLTRGDLALLEIFSFEDLFLYVADYSWISPKETLAELIKEIRKIDFIGDMAISKLVEFIDRVGYFHGFSFKPASGTNENAPYLEKDYEADVIANFKDIFPGYLFIKNQKVVGKDRLDIYAKEKITGRDVIIEIKLGSKNPRKQLMRYAFYFDKPILVSLTQKECSQKNPNVIYVVWNK